MLIRLACGDVPLDDRERTLADYGLEGDAELDLAPQTPELEERRSVDAGMPVLRAALNAAAASRMRAAAERCGTTHMKLRNPNGSHKHYRWVWLTVAQDEGGAPTLLAHWGKNRDHSDHWLWKQMGSAPPKQRTVTEVKPFLAHPLPARRHPLGVTLETTEGVVRFVVPGPYER